MLMYPFFCLGRLSTESVQVRGFLWSFVHVYFYGKELLAPRPTPNMEDHLLSAVNDCLFRIFAATVHAWRASPPSATWGRAMQWWQGTHLVWIGLIWLRIGTSGGLLWTPSWTFGFHKMLGSSWVAAQWAASQEWLSSNCELCWCI
jgi:hypothetical protein